MLLEELLKRNLISEENYNKALEELQSSQKSEEKVIIEKGLSTVDQLLKIKSEFLKIPVFKEVSSLQIPEKVLSIIPEESAKYYQMVPLKLSEGVFEVGMLNPKDIKAKEVLLFLARQHKIEAKIYLISESDFEEILKKYRDIQEVVGEALTELEDGKESSMEILDEDERISKSVELEDDAPIIKMVAAILRHAVEGKSSDIHIEPTETEVKVRIRVDGFLADSLKIPIATHSAIVARIKILSRLRIDETRIPQDGRFSTRIDGKEIDFRVSTFPTKLGEKVVIRILDPNEGLRSYKEIGLSENNLRILREQITKPYGMVLSTGPTGSGKTTTLYSVLQQLNQPDVNIVTLEDPIEYFVPGINQSQVRPEIGYTFAKGLRSVVRQDPDIIMVGEIRDEESAALATQAALTGHIVLSTIHTNNAIGVVSRLIDMKVRPFLIPSSLNISIGQRLARRLCPHCMEKVEPLPKIEKMIIDELSKIRKDVRDQFKIPNKIYIYKSRGCSKCNNKGEKGRIGIFEILKMTKDLEKIIIENPTENALMIEANRQGMVNMRQDAIIKALEGKLSIEEVLRVTEGEQI
ncbi:MAG TPA: ATPase, T2SS/T4P/T4SS family [Candidatus Pacearchaeota archaeon]|nr:ATPase, T2SS/T4P/T4SS family [Candidatus Pacearchaeota archaeon]